MCCEDNSHLEESAFHLSIAGFDHTFSTLGGDGRVVEKQQGEVPILPNLIVSALLSLCLFRLTIWAKCNADAVSLSYHD